MVKVIRNFLILIFLSSCFSKNNDNKELQVENEKVVPIEIINGENENKKDDTSKSKINLDEIEIKKLNENNIDIEKFYGILEQAKKGDRESILLVASIYEKLGLKDKYNEIIKLGIKYKVQEIIRSIIAKDIDNNNFNTYEKYVNSLNKNDKENKKIIVLYNEKKANVYIKSKQFDKALLYYKTAYKYGSKIAPINIGYIYLTKNDVDEATKWFNIAYKYNKKDAGYELGVIFYNKKEYKKALPFLEEQYKYGEKKIALNIGISYFVLGDFEQALKWYKIAKDNGFENEANNLIDQLNSSRKGSYNVN